MFSRPISSSLIQAFPVNIQNISSELQNSICFILRLPDSRSELKSLDKKIDVLNQDIEEAERKTTALNESKQKNKKKLKDINTKESNSKIALRVAGVIGLGIIYTALAVSLIGLPLLIVIEKKKYLMKGLIIGRNVVKHKNKLSKIRNKIKNTEVCLNKKKSELSSVESAIEQKNAYIEKKEEQGKKIIELLNAKILMINNNIEFIEGKELGELDPQLKIAFKKPFYDELTKYHSALEKVKKAVIPS